MKIAIAQTEIIWENKESNFWKAREFINKAKKQGANLILFPEMSFTGFTMNTEYSSEDDFYSYNTIKSYAMTFGINIGFGWVKRLDDRAENHYTILSDEGGELSDYVKIHPFSYGGEDKYFVGGDKIVNFCINGISFSNFICYDLRFPEVFQMASYKAHCIIVAANWPMIRRDHWNKLLVARAIENQAYIVAVNCCGEDIGGVTYSGDSCVVNPNGEVVATATFEELLLFDLKDDVELYRKTFPVKADRREQLYFGIKNRG